MSQVSHVISVSNVKFKVTRFHKIWKFSKNLKIVIKKCYQKLSSWKKRKLDNSKLGSTQQQKICCQDHILTENIWFVCSETSYIGIKEEMSLCGTTKQQLKIGLLSHGSWRLSLAKSYSKFWGEKEKLKLTGRPVEVLIDINHKRNTNYRPNIYHKSSLTLFNPGFLVLNLLGGGQICPHPLTMGVMGGRFQNWVGTSYLTEIDARQKDLPLSDT